VRSVRIATHCTEADISRQHIMARAKLGMDVSGFLMMSHMSEPGCAGRAGQADGGLWRALRLRHRQRRRADMDGYRDRLLAYDRVLKPETERGVHAHHNLSLGVANSIVAVQTGALRVDASLAGMGAGAGNAPLEVFIAAAERKGWHHGCDLFKLMDAAEDARPPAAGSPGPGRSRDAQPRLRGVYSSFLRHAEQASQDYGIDTRDILIELGRRKMVGGQEDMIIDVALDMLKTP
jgi:4-hydroxy 2-oxovalerate aldolase